MIITLLGFMGSGKSSIGRRLAKKMDIELIDLDDYIEKKEGKSISKIFDKYGEDHFRELETQYLKKLVKSDKNLIIALGGGTPCTDENWKYISKTTSIYLNRTEDYLFENLKSKKAKRPIIKDLGDKQLNKLISEKMSVRSPFYERADIIIDLDLSKSAMTTIIADAIKYN